MVEPGPAGNWRKEPSWKIVSASVVGTGHVRSGRPCQDSTQYRYLPIAGAPADTLVAAVADGAGSALYSDRGARIAAAAGIATVADMLAAERAAVSPERLEEILVEAVAAARNAVDEVAQANGHGIREYATTFLVGAHVNGHLGAAQVGDGAIVAAPAGGAYELITNPDRGEYANETSFVTQSASVASSQIRVLPDFRPRNIAMFSDGIQNLVLDYRDRTEPIPHAPFFAGVFSWLENQPDGLPAYTGLRSFLGSQRVRARTNDDVSLLLATLL